MIAMDVIEAIILPPESRVNQRVPKKLLVENGAPTASDKRHINEGIEELLWVATLKPTTTGVPEYRDTDREYLEIAVLLLILRSATKTGRLVELIHRAIPYPVLLLTQQSDAVTLSLAHKRWSQGEAGKMVLDNSVLMCEIVENDTARAFLTNMALTSRPRTHLLALYQGWIDCLETYLAANITGLFVLPASEEAALARSNALVEYDRLTHQIATLRAQAVHESQVNRRVELNLEIKRLETELADMMKRL